MSRLPGALFVCILAAVPLSAGFSQSQDFRPATPAELAMKSVEAMPGAPAVVLDWIRVDDDTNSTSSEYHRIKVFNEEGKRYADVEVPYAAGYPVNGRVTDISARTIQPDGKIVPFDGKVYDKVLYKSGGLRLRAKTFSLAGVQPGSILEYRFQRRWSDLLLLNTTWAMQRDVPVLHTKMTLKPYNSQGEYGTFFTYFNLPPGKVPARINNVYELELENVPALISEDLAPPEEHLTTRVNFYYTTSRIKPDQFWTETSKKWTKETEDFIGKHAGLKSVADSLAGKTPLETAQNIYAKAQSFKNLSFEDEPKEKDKRNASDVVAKSEGYRSEINRAFVAMARAAGLEANVIRVAPRDERFFAQQIPDAEQMSGEIASVTIDGKPVYVDPGTPTAPFGLVSWEKSSVPGFRLVKGQPAELMVVAEQRADDAVLHRAADLKLNEDELEGTITVTYRGQEALRARLRSWGEDDAARSKAFEDETKAWFPDGATVKLTELKGATTHAEPVVAKYEVSLPGFVSAAGSRTVLPMSVFASSAKNPFAPATRTHAIYYPFPHQEEDEVKLTLPESMAAAAVPPPVTIDAGAVTYSNEMRSTGREITFKRKMAVATMLIDSKHYGALRTFYSTVATADQKPLVLVNK